LRVTEWYRTHAGFARAVGALAQLAYWLTGAVFFANRTAALQFILMDRAPRTRAGRPRLLAILGVSIGMLLVLELVLRLLGLVGLVALPSTRILGFDQYHAGRSAETAQRLFQDDRALLYRMRPGFERQYNRMVIYPWLQAQYGVRTNDDGFRT